MQQELFSEQIQLPPLRSYQTKMLRETYNVIRNAPRPEPILLYLPTGGGKTVLVTRIQVDAYRKSKLPSLFIVDMDCLVEQTVQTFRRYGIEPGVIKAGYKPNVYAPIQIASIQSLTRRDLPKASVVIIDEAHISFSPSYRIIFEAYSSSWIIGCTATPYRTKKTEGLGDLYKHLVKGPEPKELIDLGKESDFKEGLVPPSYYGFPARPDLSQVRVVRGDFAQEELANVCDTDEQIDRLVKEWHRLCNPDTSLRTARLTICFAINIRHSQRIAAAFQEAGVPAAHIDGNAPSVERKLRFKQLRSREILVLTSVDLLSKGFDLVEIQCVILARPTKSKIIYFQQMGRGLRVAPHVNKSDCIVMDYAGNVRRFGFVTEPQQISLTVSQDKEPGEAPVKECPIDQGGCGSILYAFQTACPCCGYRFPQKPSKLDPSGSMVRLLSKAEQQQQRKYHTLARQAMARGHSPGWALMKFKEEFGHFPANDFRKGSVFQGKSDQESRLVYFDYLNKIASKKGEEAKWIKKWFLSEFGNSEEVKSWIDRQLQENPRPQSEGLTFFPP